MIEQQNRRRIHHGFRRFHVRTLEPDVVDVVPEVHELALEMQERLYRIEGQIRCQLDDARNHQRRHLARAARHRRGSSP